MPTSIPEHKIQEVREAVDVVDLVSGYVTLKKSGQNFFGLCPFHPEKTPSFSVNPDKQIFHCFGCGVGGNVFTFLMRLEGINFPESIKFLARRASIQLDFEEKDDSSHQENETLYHINEFAARFYQESLLAPAGKNSVTYLKDRGFNSDAIKAFGLGFAPPGWDNLINHARKESVDIELLLRAGLILKKDGGGYYDRFRDRVMFTIWNLSGRVVAFGGRKLSAQDDSPKYINSPESPVYEKGKLLYGLYQNRDEIRKLDKVIFVEGYTDLMSMVCGGIKNVAATSGTALTEDHARLIHRYTKNVVLMYDSDTAGSAATLRGADILLAIGLDVFIASLPPGHDPDSFLKKEGAAGVITHLKSAVNLFDFKLNQLLKQPPEERNDLIRSLLESLAKIKDNIQRSILLSKISEKLEISEKILWSELESIVRKTKRGEARSSGIGKKLNEVSKISKIAKVEVAIRDLVRILIHDWTLADFVFSNLDFKLISDSKMTPVLSYLKNRHKAGRHPDESALINHFNEIELTSFIVNTLSEKWEGLELKRWALDCILTILKEKIQIRLNGIREDIRLAQKNGQPVKELLQTCIELEQQKQELNAKSFQIDNKKT